jgi:hypothetical protein
MLSTHSIEKYLERCNPELRDIVWELRNIVASASPEAIEVTRRNGLVFFDQRRGGPVSAGICQIIIQSDHIRLAFIHGAFLPDPENLLEGDQRYKRFVRIVSYEHAPWDALRNLVHSSSRFDPRVLDVNDLAKAPRHVKGCPTPAAADGRPAPPESMLRDTRVGEPHKSRPSARR